jgi:autotransporter-associated beta strand protein
MLTFEGSTPNTFTGEMLANAGMLVLAKDSFIPAVPGDMIIGSGLPGVPGATVLYGRHDQIWNRITINRASSLDLNGWDEYSGDVTLNGSAFVSTGGGTLYLGQGVNLFVNPRGLESAEIDGRIGLGAGSHRFHVAAGDRPPDYDIRVNASIIQMSSAADIVKDGPGGILLNSLNSFSGVLTINEGKLYAGNAFTFGTKAGGTIVNNNASLALDGSMWVREEPLTLNSTNPVALSSVAPSNTWSGNITLQQTSGIHVGFGVFHVMGLFDCCGGVISGPGGITKSGSGTFLISGLFPNDYAGPDHRERRCARSLAHPQPSAAWGRVHHRKGFDLTHRTFSGQRGPVFELQRDLEQRRALGAESPECRNRSLPLWQRRVGHGQPRHRCLAHGPEHESLRVFRHHRGHGRPQQARPGANSISPVKVPSTEVPPRSSKAR